MDFIQVHIHNTSTKHTFPAKIIPLSSERVTYNCSCARPAPRIFGGKVLFHNNNTVFYRLSYISWTLVGHRNFDTLFETSLVPGINWANFQEKISLMTFHEEIVNVPMFGNFLKNFSVRTKCSLVSCHIRNSTILKFRNYL